MAPGGEAGDGGRGGGGVLRSRVYQPLHQSIALSCISNPVGGDLIGTTRWSGVSLQCLLPDLHLRAGGTHLKVNAADGFFEVVSVASAVADERVLLAYAWDGVPRMRTTSGIDTVAVGVTIVDADQRRLVPGFPQEVDIAVVPACLLCRGSLSL
ncbi:MAG: molybdopterin-dependent oxidoreductase [Candidatus Latescibacterota bacterium]